MPPNLLPRNLPPAPAAKPVASASPGFAPVSKLPIPPPKADAKNGEPGATMLPMPAPSIGAANLAMFFNDFNILTMSSPIWKPQLLCHFLLLLLLKPLMILKLMV